MRKRVGILRGGSGPQYYHSLHAGQNVLDAMPYEYDPVDVFIDRSGGWHVGGIGRRPEEILPHLDVVFNALYGSNGDEAVIARTLEQFDVPFTGSNARALSVGASKLATKKIAHGAGLRVPYGVVVERGAPIEQAAQEVWQAMAGPWIAKPNNTGWSEGVRVARNRSELEQVLAQLLATYDLVLVEEYVRGREATVGIIESFRGQDQYALPPVEINRAGEAIFEQGRKAMSGHVHSVPGRFSADEKVRLEAIARAMHDAIGARHYSRSDMVVHPSGTVFLLEINTLPDFGEHSPFGQALSSVGISHDAFIGHVIERALGEL